MKMVLYILILLVTFSSSARAGEESLRGALKKYLLANSRWPGAAIVIDNIEVPGGGPSLEGFTTFQILSRNGARSTGRVSFNVRPIRGGRSVRTVVVTANVSFLREVVVAVRPVKMREQIGADDVELVSRDVSVIPAAAALSLADVVGKAARRPISAGRIVREDYLQRPRMVKRGQVLEVRVKGGFIMVRSRATAVSDGFLGAPIKARTAGGREITGLVSGPGQMVVNLR